MSKKILLIDDEREVVQIMRKQIQTAGYEAHVAYNGEEGLKAAQRIHPHLILTDIAMPVMDGIVFYYELKNRQDLSHIPVIVASAYGTTEAKMRDLGVKDFLIKPFDKDTLLAKLGSFFDGQKAYRILIGTKMVYLTKSILDETGDVAQKLDIQMTNDARTVVHEAVCLKPDMIILDLDLFIAPSAGEIVAQLRQQPDLKETKILLMRSMMVDLTASGQLINNQMDIARCLDNGASHYVGYLNRDAFLSIVQEYCG